MPVDVLMQAKKLFLAKLKEKSNFAALREDYQDEWEFHDLLRDLTDEDFKQICIDKTATESTGKSFKEDIDKCVELAEQGKRAASKYFKKGVKLQVYYTKINNTDRVLNINLINYNRSEPTRISDILQQEKDIKELNIYCNKKHEIHARRKGKERHYKFKEGAYYEMTSTWPVKDEFGNVSICTMIMNVSSDGITEVLKFNGEDFVQSKEALKLIEQNDELYIQGLSLHDAVMKSLKGKAADVVPTANNNFQNESITAYREEPEGELDPKVDADNSLSPSSINSNASTQTEVKLQQIATQTEIDSQPIATQTEVNLQQIATQTEVDSQQAETGTQTEINSQQAETGTQTEINSQQTTTETQTEVNLQQIATQTEVDSQQAETGTQTEINSQQTTTETQAEIDLQHTETQTEVNLQHTETQTEVASQHIGIQTEINSQQITDLQNELGRAKQTIVELEKLQAELAQKDEKLAELREKVQELESMRGKEKLRQELEVVNAKKEELKSELKKLKKELYQVQEGKSNLEGKFDQLERSNKEMNGNQKQLSEQVLGLQKKLSESKEENQALSNELESAKTEKKRANQELAEAGQRIETLKKQTSDLQDKLEKKERESKIEINEIRKELTQLKENLERNEKEFKSVYEEKRRLEDKLKIVNARKENLEKELNQAREDTEQIMVEKCQGEKCLKDQLRELDQKHEAQQESSKQEIDELKWKVEGLENMHDEFKKRVALTVESMGREHEDHVDGLEEEFNELSEIIADEIQIIEEMKEKIENLNNQVKYLEGQVTHEQKMSEIPNDYVQKLYTIMGDISNEPDNVPRKKRKLSKSSSVDSRLDSDEENYDNGPSSNISPISSIEKVKDSKNVGSLPSPHLGSVAI